MGFVCANVWGKFIYLIGSDVRQVCCEYVDGFGQGCKEITKQQAHTVFNMVSLAIEIRNIEGSVGDITGIEVGESWLQYGYGDRYDAASCADIGQKRHTSG